MCLLQLAYFWLSMNLAFSHSKCVWFCTMSVCINSCRLSSCHMTNLSITPPAFLKALSHCYCPRTVTCNPPQMPVWSMRCNLQVGRGWDRLWWLLLAHGVLGKMGCSHAKIVCEWGKRKHNNIARQRMYLFGWFSFPRQLAVERKMILKSSFQT